ncbi:MAG: hypothetical protein KatS3mg077_1556 [Candidatus Binatia bacterium]|nr:MAG: hypothetical protein KatS3mg077_1556 [Candidatus Binatia bacterium]
MRQRSSSRCGSSWGRWWVVFVLLPLAVPTSAATFTHPQEGFTIWYPDGWHVHERPRTVWATRQQLRDAYNFEVLSLAGQLSGAVVSSCPPERYVAVKDAAGKEAVRIVPEGEAEIAIIRSISRPNCKDWLDGGPPEDGGGEPFNYRLELRGRPLLGHSISQVFTDYPLVKVFVCREESGKAYLFRLTVAGMFSDFSKHRAHFEHLVGSFSWERGGRR